mmetsp:Transcript_12435/g.23384  ORF Transcript_12435/g.23384 Transcript_12435/m.23384 type:complete len:94 (+) Transcript_12435:1035-1316(+)
MPPTRSKAGGLERHHDFGSVVDGGGKDESGTVLHFHQIAACIFLVETMRSVQRRIRATDGTAARVSPRRGDPCRRLDERTENRPANRPRSASS